MHHLHENTLPCYHESLHNVLEQLRDNDLQIATRIFLRQGYFLEMIINCTKSRDYAVPACRNIHFLIISLSADPKEKV